MAARFLLRLAFMVALVAVVVSLFVAMPATFLQRESCKAAAERSGATWHFGIFDGCVITGPDGRPVRYPINRPDGGAA